MWSMLQICYLLNVLDKIIKSKYLKMNIYYGFLCVLIISFYICQVILAHK